MNLPDDIKTRDDFPALIDHLGLKRGVEIGVCQGAYSEFLLSNTKLDILYSIDPWNPDEEEVKGAFKRCDINCGKQEKRYEETRARLAKFGQRSQIIRKTSHDSHDAFKDGSLDFIYLDGSHRFTGFSLDMMQWYPKLREGGLFAGHDYWYKYRCEVIPVVCGFAIEHKQFFYLTLEERKRPKPGHPPSWWWIKKARNKGEYVKMLAENRAYYLNAVAKMKREGMPIDVCHEYLYS